MLEKLKFNRGTNKEEGFTLIELLVVILIIGILAAIAIPAYLNHRDEASLASLKSDLKNAAIAMETDAIKSQGRYALALPSNVLISKGNNLTLKDQSGSTNIASGSDKTNGIKRPGHSAGRYTSVIANKPVSESIDDKTWRDSYMTGDVFGGIFWEYIPEEPLKSGQKFTSQVDIKSNRDWCYTPRTEEWVGSTQYSLSVGQVCGVANEWKTVTMTHTTTHDDVIRVTPTYYMSHKQGEVIEYKNPFIVFGDKIGNYATLANDELFCIEGTTESKKEEYWNYSKVEGGVKPGKC